MGWLLHNTNVTTRLIFLGYDCCSNDAVTGALHMPLSIVPTAPLSLAEASSNLEYILPTDGYTARR